jgi:hypothetical protein
VLAMSEILSVHLPTWVGAKKLPTDATFFNDDDVTVPGAAFEETPPLTHQHHLYAYLSPDDDLLRFGRNGVQIGEQQFAIAIEYEPLPPDPSCLDDEPLFSHWPLSSGDAPAPVIDVTGGINLGIRTGAAAKVVYPLPGTRGNALHVYGATSYRSSSAPTALLQEFMNGEGAVSIWFKPTSLTGTATLMSVGGLLEDPIVFPFFTESAAKNVVFQLQRVGDELRIVWENSLGVDVMRTTSGLDLVSGQTYQVVVSRHASPVSGLIDIGLYVSQKGVGRIYEDAFFDVPRPTGAQSGSAAVSLAGDWGTKFFTGVVDAMRIWNEPLGTTDAWELFTGETLDEVCGLQ